MYNELHLANKYNPYSDECLALQGLIADAIKRKESLLDEINSHDNTDINLLKSELQNCLYAIDASKHKFQESEKAIAALRPRVAQAHSDVSSNPFTWFTSEQRKYRQRHDALVRSIDDHKSKIATELKFINETKIKHDQIQARINEYLEFDDRPIRADIDDLDIEIANHNKTLDEISKLKQEVDSRLEPILAEIERLTSEKLVAERTIRTAKNYYTQLSMANNRYERALIHKQCKKDLGEEKPQIIISRQERMINSIERDYEKAHKRATAIGFIASRTIDLIVIDGNNMCYEGSTFVGLSPLRQVTSELQNKFDVIVVFDSAIRKMTKSNDDQIRSVFDKKIVVHIVPTQKLADETILDIASSNPQAFVISNDRYSEFKDKEVVKNNRLIRHEIVSNRVLIHDLQVNLTYA